MMYKVRIKNSAKGDLRKLKHSNLKDNYKEIEEQLKKNPYKPNQGFEKLEPPLLKKYSRRINIQHRVVYTVDEQHKTVNIYSAWSHYEK
ncbi:Txe/YoeB family addiction module toxin [Limosilactobacillus sp. c11Ua_112_M]|uniref:Txe/YoeB family addiction module toxin n=1 Tax=Limosilactobacillus TaxID=2742598 RepID=UPI00177BEE5A|nr:MULTISPECIES: Txe/YoeB family addiction module toxin [Limosilactobacillus]MBD8087267.1 Txe/YoeB family addiction module toxin [Limosilactobacillus portuensis]MEC4741747.1 Txe/YoeB family addiction module toxin [Limosilactobacillus sp. c10Ua_36]